MTCMTAKAWIPNYVYIFFILVDEETGMVGLVLVSDRGYTDRMGMYMGYGT